MDRAWNTVLKIKQMPSDNCTRKTFHHSGHSILPAKKSVSGFVFGNISLSRPAKVPQCQAISRQSFQELPMPWLPSPDMEDVQGLNFLSLLEMNPWDTWLYWFPKITGFSQTEWLVRLDICLLETSPTFHKRKYALGSLGKWHCVFHWRSPQKCGDSHLDRGRCLPV